MGEGHGGEPGRTQGVGLVCEADVFEKAVCSITPPMARPSPLTFLRAAAAGRAAGAADVAAAILRTALAPAHPD